MTIDLSQIILAVITAILGGGWFVNYRQKKAIESASADKANMEVSQSKVDLTDSILKKYQETVLNEMGQHAEDHRQILEHIGNINEYLNGDYQKFLKSKKAS